MVVCFICLESQLLEEISATLCLLLACDVLLVDVSLVEDLLEVLLDFDLLLWLDQVAFIDSLLQIDIDNITCGEYMAHIDVLDEWLHGLGSLLNLLFAHGLGDFSWLTSQASDEAVCKALVAISIVKGLDDDSLLAGMTACK